MKVLFLAFSFPPANFPASTRTWNVARELSRGGCDVTVVTHPAAAWTRNDSPRDMTAQEARGIRRLEIPPRWTFLAPWQLRAPQAKTARLLGGVARRAARTLGIGAHAGWTVEARRACARLTRGDVDVILATGSPFESFEIARWTAQRLGRPFVVDYRDPWTSNPHQTAPRSARRLEAEIVAAAAAVTVVSPSWLTLLEADYDLDGKGHVVTNGYDDDEISTIVPWHFDHFAITYVGQFYPPKRAAGPLLTALRALGDRVPGWKLHYLGPQQEMVMEAAREHGMTDRVTCHGMTSRKESLAAMAGSAVSVVITSVEDEAGDDDRGILPSKVFDTIGLCRPMLVIAPPGGDIETIVRGRPLTATVTAGNVTAISDYLAAVAASDQSVPPMPQYSWQRRGHLMKEILENAVASGPGD